jgi:tetratricopeptide (TPR) repeat protein
MAVKASQDRVFKNALSLHQSGARVEAIKLYQQVLKKAPEHAEALHMLGFASFQQGDKAQAITLLQRAISVKPDLGEAYYHFGVVLQSLNRFDEAIRLYRHAATLLPGSLDVQRTIRGEPAVGGAGVIRQGLRDRSRLRRRLLQQRRGAAGAQPARRSARKL